MPHYFKVSLVKTLVTRAYRLCSNWHLFDTEIDNLIELLMRNGYNKVFLKTIIGIQFNRLHTNNTDKKHGPEQRKFFIRLPFLRDPSNRLLGSINSCLNKLKLYRKSALFRHFLAVFFRELCDLHVGRIALCTKKKLLGSEHYRSCFEN